MEKTMTQEELDKKLAISRKAFQKMENQANSLRTTQDKLNNRAQSWRVLANNEMVTLTYGSTYVLRGETVLAKLSSLASNSLEEAFVLSIIIQDYIEAGKLPEKHLAACQKELQKSHLYTNDYAKELDKLEKEIGIKYISEHV